MRQRCLVIGASGQLGSALCRLLQRAGHEVLETAYQNQKPGQILLDLGRREEIVSILQDLKPKWILVAGAFCNVDRCETEPETCTRINVEGPRAIAQWAKGHDGTVAYYSTDHVFDGSREAHTESDAVHPLNVYAQSKVEAEEMLRECLPEQHLILRTAWLYGPDPARRNFVLRLMDQVSTKRPVQVPVDQWGSPTYTEDLAEATRFLLERGLGGTFHATGPDFLDRVSWAKRVCLKSGLDPNDVVAVPTDQLKQAAPRPLRVRLDCRKLAAAGVGRFRGLEAGLDALRRSPVGTGQ